LQLPNSLLLLLLRLLLFLPISRLQLHSRCLNLEVIHFVEIIMFEKVL
jgi:hypothetical protein